MAIGVPFLVAISSLEKHLEAWIAADAKLIGGGLTRAIVDAFDRLSDQAGQRHARCAVAACRRRDRSRAATDE